jgi:hypothetical protein
VSTFDRAVHPTKPVIWFEDSWFVADPEADPSAPVRVLVANRRNRRWHGVRAAILYVGPFVAAPFLGPLIPAEVAASFRADGTVLAFFAALGLAFFLFADTCSGGELGSPWRNFSGPTPAEDPDGVLLPVTTAERQVADGAEYGSAEHRALWQLAVTREGARIAELDAIRTSWDDQQ